MKQYEYRLTKYLGLIEQRNPQFIITPEQYALQKWHPCYRDYLQKDGQMTKRAAPMPIDQEEEQADDDWDENKYKFDPNRPRYTEADEQFFYRR